MKTALDSLKSKAVFIFLEYCSQAQGRGLSYHDDAVHFKSFFTNGDSVYKIHKIFTIFLFIST